jgi:hypothetical protein
MYTVDDYSNHYDYFIEATSEGFVAECNNIFCNYRSDPFEDYSDAEYSGQAHSSTQD